jgi:serine/threonine-protein kinase
MQEIARLQRDKGNIAGRVANAQRRANDATQSAHRASSISSANSYLRDAQRYNEEVAREQKNLADMEDRIAREQGRLSDAQKNLFREEEREQRDRQREEERRIRDNEQRLREMTSTLGHNDTIARMLRTRVATQGEEKKIITIRLPTGAFEYDPAKPLGRRGGFGQVFLGKDSSGTEVAVKKLHVSPDDVGHRELVIAEELRGKPFEHVIPFIDSGEDADGGGYFVVMPKAERSLQSVVDAGAKMAAAEAADVLRQIASGLVEVGDLVHRDLKPDNILFHDGKWKVADFGIARFIEDATSSNTLKGFLTETYAAPEQFRFERTTHATDVYSLGCIGFCLLTGSPPFTTDPPQEHQHAAVPALPSSDPRVGNLIVSMLRKPPAGRPILTRVRDTLVQILKTPLGATGSPAALLANAGMSIARNEQAAEAREEAAQAAQNARSQLADGAFAILAENAERLWGKIHAQAPNARRVGGGGIFQVELGNASMAVNASTVDRIEEGTFRNSHWDVVAKSEVVVSQSAPSEYAWSATLLYAKPKGAAEYRWYEIMFWSWTHKFNYAVFAAPSLRDADLGIAPITHSISPAFGPVIIDDDKEDEFHERWMWIMARAATGQLRQPDTLPIKTWPPRM